MSTSNALRPLVYLACPYSHDDPAIRRRRFELASMAAALLIKETGEHVFSPISHTHPIAEHGNLPWDFDFWESSAWAYLSVSHKMYVLCLKGWGESTGVVREIDIAKSLGTKIEYLFEDWLSPQVNTDAAVEKE